MVTKVEMFGERFKEKMTEQMRNFGLILTEGSHEDYTTVYVEVRSAKGPDCTFNEKKIVDIVKEAFPMAERIFLNGKLHKVTA